MKSRQQEIVAMHRANPAMTQRALARALGCHESTISNALRFRKFDPAPCETRKVVQVPYGTSCSSIAGYMPVTLPAAPWEVQR